MSKPRTTVFTQWLKDPAIHGRLERYARALIGKHRAAAGLRPSDLIHDALSAAMSGRRTFRGSDRHSFVGWAIVILRHTFRRRMRRAAKEQPLTTYTGEQLEGKECDPASSARLTLSDVALVLEKLPPLQRDIYRLRFEQGLSRAEAAAQLQLSVNELSYQQHLLVERLREALEDGEP